MTLFSEITGTNENPLPMTGIQQWDQEGVLHLKGFIPEPLIEAYVEERTRILSGTQKWRSGWNDPCPYLRVPSMMDLATEPRLMSAIAPLIGGNNPGLHLCLTGFESTERAWHQDRFLNPESVGEHYIAAWIVLEDVSESAGPFEYVPGSHRWPVIERSKVWDRMRLLGQDPHAPTWPSDSQGFVGEACEAAITENKAEVRQFLGKRGDVLLWHASLVHRGSLPKDRSLERRALIAHYSSVAHRPDMPDLRKHSNGSFYFHFPQFLTEPSESTHKSKTA